MDPAPLTHLFEHLPGAILVFARIAALFVAGPVIGEIYTPMQIKALLAMAVTVILYPLAVAKGMPMVAMDGVFIVLLLKETMVGLSLGFFISLYTQGVRFGGDLINRHAGFSAAEYFNPDTQDVAGPMGDFLHLTLMLLFFATDGHHFFFAALARSYDLVPVGAWTLTAGFGNALADGFNQMSIIAVTVSFPVLAAIMSITMAEGVITRAVPQINILHVSFALKILVSLLVMYTGLPAAVAFLGTVLATMQGAGFAVLGMMGG
jgi:flagellar biosynthesis protein FliR